MSDVRCERCGARSERIRELLAEVERLRASRQDFKELAEKCCRKNDHLLVELQAMRSSWEIAEAEIERLRAENADLGRRLGLLEGDLSAQKILVHEARVRLEDAERENAALLTCGNGPGFGIYAVGPRSDFEKDMM